MKERVQRKRVKKILEMIIFIGLVREAMRLGYEALEGTIK